MIKNLIKAITFIVVFSELIILSGCGSGGNSLEDMIRKEKMYASGYIQVDSEVEDNIVEKQGLFRKKLEKEGQKVEVKLKSRASYVTYKNIELDMIFSDGDNNEVGRRRIRTFGSLEPYGELKSEHKIMNAPRSTRYIGVRYADSEKTATTKLN